jgi:hypothetical protein
MLAEEYLGRSRLFRRLMSGPHRQLVELYAARLVKDGFAHQGTWRCLNLVGDLLSWITKSRAKLTSSMKARSSGTFDTERGSSPSNPATGQR